jgi:ectoine hydroxylase-related dioxygenase (phytanoyl-CoA dioxygenase family)
MTSAFFSEGFVIVHDLLDAGECATVAGNAQTATTASAGTRRLLDLPWCRSLASRLRAGRLRGVLPMDYVAVQCTYFEKSKTRNWLVPIHQDLSIPVKERQEAPGFSGWSEKEGELFVQAPIDLLSQLMAVRVHLDPCREEDGPLQVVPGSHALGILAPKASVEVRSTLGSQACIAGVGDALVMRPLLLHASSKASGTSLRRVLHFVFGPRELPYNLRWQHAV